MSDVKPKISEIMKDTKLNLVESLLKIKELRKQASEKYNKSLERFKALELERKFLHGWHDRIKSK